MAETDDGPDSLQTHPRRDSVAAMPNVVIVNETNWTALAGVIGGAIVGIAGVFFGWLNSQGERENAQTLADQAHQTARDLARDSRLYQDLKDAYVRTLSYLDTMRTIIHHTEPIIGPQPDPPAMPSHDDTAAMYSLVGALGSEEVIDALEEQARIGREFFARVMTVRLIREQRGAMGDELIELNDARERYAEQVRTIERLIRAELRA